MFNSEYGRLLFDGELTAVNEVTNINDNEKAFTGTIIKH